MLAEWFDFVTFGSLLRESFLLQLNWGSNVLGQLRTNLEFILCFTLRAHEHE